MILASHGIIGSQITQFVGLLDTYSGAAAAYSLRLLRTAYTGSAIRVRNSSNSEADIGFVNNVLDTASLLTHCGGGDGFVKTWYDQSGNGYDATQTTAANQPQIVSSGSVILENGKPSLSFDGTDDGLTLTSNYVIPTTFSTSWVFKRTTSAINSISFANNSASNPFLSLWFTNNDIYFRPGANSGVFLNGGTNTGQFLIMDFYTSNTWNLYRNGTSLGSQSYTSSALNLNSLGNRNGTSHNGLYQEFIIWSADQSSNRTGIETNINTYYGIY